MFTLERCIYQPSDSKFSVLFKEDRDKCKFCKYDPEKNKQCPNYSPANYYISDEVLKLVPSNFAFDDDIRA
jgi:hypothetical protein